MAHRDFSAAQDEALKNRPSFRLQGVDFLCKPGLSWKAMSRATEAVNEAGDDPDMLQDALFKFFDIVLVKSARPKMRALLDEEDLDDDDAVPVSLTQLMDVIQWLVEQYTGRPTVPSSPSSASPSETGEESRAGTSSDTESGQAA